MDKAVSSVILISVTVALAIALSSYYTGFVKLFMRYEEIGFDYAYATVKNGRAEIVVNFKNIGQGGLTVVALEINGIDLEPTGTNPFPIELPYGTNVRLRLDASPDTFRSGAVYEVAIRTASGGRYMKTVVMP